VIAAPLESVSGNAGERGCAAPYRIHGYWARKL